MGMRVLSTGGQLTRAAVQDHGCLRLPRHLGLLNRVWDAEDYDGTIGPGDEHVCDLEDCIERASEPGAHDDA